MVAAAFTLADVTEARLYTTREVADLFRVATLTVCRWCRKGKLTAGKTLGGDYRILGQEVLRAWGQMMHANPPTTARAKPPEPGEDTMRRLKDIKRRHGAPLVR